MDVTPIELRRDEQQEEARSSDVDEYDPAMTLSETGEGKESVNNGSPSLQPERQKSDESGETASSRSSTPSVTVDSAVEGTKEDVESSDDEYDPESVNPSPEPETTRTKDSQEESDDDDYDPEQGLETTSDGEGSSSTSKPAGISSLPSKPPVSAGSATVNDPATLLQEAYEAIMQSDLVKQPEFKRLTPEQQMSLIDQQLKAKGISLPQLDPHANNDARNDPDSKNPSDSQNKDCRRPNMSLPMSAKEESDFVKYTETEVKYSNRRLLDNLPENSRLFIGNLASNSVSKKDLFRICNQYGEVLHILIKGGYGFVQFKTAEQCAACIKGETGVPLHGRVMRLDASSGNKKSTGEQVKFRERVAEKDDDNDEANEIPAHCHLFITIDSTPRLVKETTNAFESAGLTLKVDAIGDEELTEAIPDAAYSGVLAACIIKESKVDLQTFEETEEGGIKFDEYVDLSPLVAVDVVKRMLPPDSASNLKRTHEETQKDYENNESPELHHPHHHRDSHHSKKQKKKDRQRERRANQGHNGHHTSYSPVPPASRHQPYPSNPYGLPQPPPHYPPHAAYPGYGQYPNANPQGNFSPGSASQNFADPSVIQMLQNLDPTTLQQVIGFIQQQQQQQQQLQQHQQFQTSAYQQPAPPMQQQYQGGYTGGYGQPAHPQPPPPAVQQPGQLNVLLSQLQTSQQPYQNQGTPPAAPPGSQQSQQQRPQQPGQSSTLMDMLSRLSKQ